MNLQGRDLSLQRPPLTGQDVALLQIELRRLGFTIPEREVSRQTFEAGTLEAVLVFQRSHQLEATGIVDESTAVAINAAVTALEPELSALVVRGAVRLQDGTAAERYLIRVLDRDLRSVQELGKAYTEVDGRFTIRYQADDFRRAELNSADLSFQIEDQEGIPVEAFQLFRKLNRQLTLVDSPQIIFRAGRDEEVELMVGAGSKRQLSEFENYVALITPILQGLEIADLIEDDRHQDITFAEGETGIPRRHITNLVVAHKFRRQTLLPAEVFYGLLRQDLPADLAGLLGLNQAIHRSALEASIRDRLIPASIAAELDILLERLQAIEVEQPVFLLQPYLYFNSLADQNAFAPDQAAFVDQKLNEQLRSEVFAEIGPVSQAMRRALDAAVARLDYAKIKTMDFRAYIRDILLAQVKRNRNLNEEATRLDRRLADASPILVSDLLQLDVPLQHNSIFADDLRRARTFEYARRIDLDRRQTQRLIEGNLLLDEADGATLTALVRDGQISVEQARDLHGILELGRLTGDHLPLVDALREQGARNVSDLVGWEQSDWQQFITEKGLPLPFGETAASYASNLWLNIGQAYPAQMLLHRIAIREAGRPHSLLDSLAPLMAHNERLIDADNHIAVNWNDVSDLDRATLETNLRDLVEWANTCRHLRVAEVINDTTLNIEQKKSSIARRLKLLDDFHRSNPDVDLRLINFFDRDSRLDWSTIEVSEQPMLRKQLMAYQRVFSLTDNPALHKQLLACGYDSALAIAGLTETQFFRTSGLALGDARTIYNQAQKAAVSTSHYLAAFQETAKDLLQQTAVGNHAPQLVNDLQSIDGYADFFGPQDFCDCEECRSLLSPAAYFVDLMHFIEQQISIPAFVNPQPTSFNAKKTGHPLFLKNRRGDLWTLQLTCENTNSLVPYLTIVNEVLESYVESVVNADVFAELSKPEQGISVNLPFNLPLEEMRLYLSHFGISLFDIFRMLHQPQQMIWRERLKLSAEEFDVITKSDVAGVKRRFGDPASLAHFPVEDEANQPQGAKRRGFLKSAGISRQQLDELLGIRFNPDLANIVISTKSLPDELMYFPEEMLDLTLGRLDFVHRFLRLWRKTCWTIPELDLILCALKEPKFPSPAGLIGADLDETAVLLVAQLVDLQDRLRMTVEELCALVNQLPVSSDFPRLPASQGDRRLYERLFDLNRLFGEKDAATHELETSFIFRHYSFNTVDSNDSDIDPKTPLLLAGLSISETDLLLYLDLLRPLLAFDPEGNVLLDRGRISVLYRHARLARALKMSADDFIQLLQLYIASDHPVVARLEQVYQLIDLRDWLKASPFSVAELRLILKGEESSTLAFAMTIEGVTAAVQDVHESLKEKSIIKDPQTIARIVLGIQLSQAADRVASLKTFLCTQFNLTSDQLIIVLGLVTVDINGAGIQVAVNADLTNGVADHFEDLAALTDLIREIESILFLFGNLSKTFNRTLGQLLGYLAWIEWDGAGVKDALAADSSDDVAANPVNLMPLLSFAHSIERILLLFDNLKFSEETVAYLTESSAALGVADKKQLTLSDVKNLTFYKNMTALGVDAEATLQSVLDAHLISHVFSDDAISSLADLWNKEETLIKSIVRSLALLAPAAVGTAPIETLRSVHDLQMLCSTLGLNAYSVLSLTQTDDYASMTKARDIVAGAFSSKYSAESERAEKLEPFHDKINLIKRDALCDYIIAREKELKFRDLPDLYAFFLLDVEMSECFRTSRVVCANSSLQLYVHRVLMNLERSSSTDLVVLNALDDKELERLKHEWEWRKNYRVWEANRKVFLYPENYLEPDLRDNKTHIFKELEDELLQKKITVESAEAAYKKYVAQFVELAHLTIAGSYYRPDGFWGTYYFFGRTAQDPPQYYYRKWEGGQVWTPWEKIELAINAPHVSAVVHLGKLFLFWVEVHIQEKTEVVGGSSVFDRYEYDISLNYSYLNENSRWLPAQKLKGLYDFPHPEILTSSDTGQSEEVTKIEDEIQKVKSLRDIYQSAVDLLKKSDSEEPMISVYSAFVDAYNDTIAGLEKRIADIKADESKLENELSTAVHQVAEDLFRAIYTTSRSYKKCYPIVPASGFGTPRISVESLWKPPSLDSVDAQWHTLDLFKNELASVVASKGKSGSAVRLLKHNDKSSKLILQSHLKQSEGILDQQAVLVKTAEPYQQLSAPILNKPWSPEIRIVGGRPNDVIFTFGDQSFLIKKRVTDSRCLFRLTTSLPDDLGAVLFNQGLEALLSLESQSKSERPVPINLTDQTKLSFNQESTHHPDFAGAYGEYYRELFFHIPFLIANHLNANQKFREAKWWYERIFDPTASESPKNKKSSKDAHSSDRSWRYVEFRDVTLQKMKDILTNDAAIEKYKADPFNPHAIARLRLSAYQKAIVMKYIDNLLDWGDNLFAQDTMESINEATMLYVLAADILGKTPVRQGKCQTATAAELTYQQIGPAIEKGSEFLIMLENVSIAAALAAAIGKIGIGLDLDAAPDGKDGAAAVANDAAIVGQNIGVVGFNANVVESAYHVKQYAVVAQNQVDKLEVIDGFTNANPTLRYPGLDVARQSSLAFCVPPNNDFLKYWDRVADRLFKIRHCMNISGVRRSLALFAPPIDPMMLVRARAAGLSLEDVLSMMAAPLPPYRFTYLIEKAKQYTQTVQAFGSALLSALEKKDVEELTLLRSVHERHILRMTKEVKVQQAREAQYQLQALVETKANVQNRIDYYSELLREGLIIWENAQQLAVFSASSILAVGNPVLIGAAISYLIPQVGSPFSLKYGGKEKGDSASAFGQVVSSAAAVAHAIAESNDIVARFARREQDWDQQLLLAQQELRQVEQQRLAAEVRTLIADRDLGIHEQNMAQANELDEFYKNKLTGLGLYNYLSTNLNRLYREAYNIACDLSRMAEHTYQFERDDTTIFIAADNWQFDRAGLLAGERLLLQLQHMERAYLEQNKREFEITQSFSMVMWHPSALLELKRTGHCNFSIPEIMFDLFYPGQYKRLIKSVRLTIPCVTGSNTNVSAKLTLLQSFVRRDNRLDTDPLDPFIDQVGIAQNTSIAASSGQNDSGLFEFSFRDERYLPFEGAGAVSNWELDLPSKLRPFDYNTISDVVVHISYTAKEDGAFRETVESAITDTVGAIAESQGLYRAFSLKHEFPNAFYRLLNPSGTQQIAEFELTKEHFPYFLSGQDLKLSQAMIFLKSKSDQPVNASNLTMKINGKDLNSGWTLVDDVMQRGDVDLSGSPIGKWTIVAEGNGLAKDEVGDMLVLLSYKV